MLGDALQNVDKVVVRIDLVQAAGDDQALNDAYVLCAELCPGKEPVSTTHGNNTQCAFEVIRVCALDKVHKFSGWDTHPASLAPAGSTWGGPGGNKWPEALQKSPSIRRGA